MSFQWAIWWRFRQRFGVKFNDKSLNFIGKQVVPINQVKPPFWRVNRPLNQHLVNMQHLKPENIKFYVDHINAEKFKFFSGYPSIIYAFCSSVENLGLKVENPPQFVFTGAEKLLENQKSCIERVLNCTVTDQYGFSEGAGNASRCKEGVFHEDFEFGILEPKEPKEPKQNSLTTTSGEILATGFSNYAMPFIRYEVGDSATWTKEKCTCGRNSDVILNIEGRSEDFILTPEGTKILRFDYLFKDTRDIEECQVVQYKKGEIVFKIVKRKTYSPRVERELTQGVKKWISPTMKVKFDYVKEIERTNTGKFKAVKSFL